MCVGSDIYDTAAHRNHRAAIRRISFAGHVCFRRLSGLTPLLPRRSASAGRATLFDCGWRWLLDMGQISLRPSPCGPRRWPTTTGRSGWITRIKVRPFDRAAGYRWDAWVNEHRVPRPNPSATRRCCIWKRPVELDADGSATANLQGISSSDATRSSAPHFRAWGFGVPRSASGGTASRSWRRQIPHFQVHILPFETGVFPLARLNQRRNRDLIARLPNPTSNAAMGSHNLRASRRRMACPAARHTQQRRGTLQPTRSANRARQADRSAP